MTEFQDHRPLWSITREREQESQGVENEKMIAKRERELASLGARQRVDPPPELSPSEKREREQAERAEGNQQTYLLGRKTPETRQENLIKEDLRMRLIGRELERQEKRNAEYQRRVRPQRETLEREISKLDAELAAEDQRHAQAAGELKAKRDDATGKVGELSRSLPPEESTEDRLRRLELVT